MKAITEDNIETLAIKHLQSLGWQHLHGLSIAPATEQQERESFEQIVLIDRLRKSVGDLNSHILADAREQAIQKILRIYFP
jgi:Type I restriction enzyme R protein N terminus (HSDR_N).